MQQSLVVSSHATSAKRKRDIGKNVVHPMTLLPPGVCLGQHQQQASSTTSDSKTMKTSKFLSVSTNNNQEIGRTLDGFFLLDCCRVDFPDEASQVVLSGLHITQVIAEDLLYFSNLARIDMSDNEAPLEPFGCLPALVELDFQCNALQRISLKNSRGFHNLEVLHLSYNCLTPEDVKELSSLLKIRELYLANNMIRSLPPIMDRFTRLETLSLERNNIVGDGIFSFLGVMPRLKNLNLSHNKITGFPESALFFEEKRGAAFHQLLYLNLAHNQLTEEENIFFTSELHSLQKLVLYGNPLAHGALIPFDKTKLAYDPVPHLTASFEQQERKVLIALAYPESRKRTSNSYENVEIYKMIPNEVQFKTPFRSRSNRFNITDYYKKEEVSSPLQEVVQKEMPKSAPTKCFALDPDNDSTFLTGVGIEDIPTSATTIQSPKDEEGVGLLPAIPSYAIQRSLAVSSNVNPSKARAAINALRFHLEHPLTSHDDSDLIPSRARQLTKSFESRQRPRIVYEPKFQQQQRQLLKDIGNESLSSLINTSSALRPKQATIVVDQVLADISKRVAAFDMHHHKKKTGELIAPSNADDALNALVSTALQVSDAYNSKTGTTRK